MTEPYTAHQGKRLLRAMCTQTNAAQLEALLSTFCVLKWLSTSTRYALAPRMMRFEDCQALLKPKALLHIYVE